MDPYGGDWMTQQPTNTPFQRFCLRPEGLLRALTAGDKMKWVPPS